MNLILRTNGYPSRLARSIIIYYRYKNSLSFIVSKKFEMKFIREKFNGHL